MRGTGNFRLLSMLSLSATLFNACTQSRSSVKDEESTPKIFIAKSKQDDASLLSSESGACFAKKDLTIKVSLVSGDDKNSEDAEYALSADSELTYAKLADAQNPTACSFANSEHVFLVSEEWEIVAIQNKPDDSKTTITKLPEPNSSSQKVTTDYIAPEPGMRSIKLQGIDTIEVTKQDRTTCKLKAQTPFTVYIYGYHKENDNQSFLWVQIPKAAVLALQLNGSNCISQNDEHGLDKAELAPSNLKCIKMGDGFVDASALNNFFGANGCK